VMTRASKNVQSAGDKYQCIFQDLRASRVSVVHREDFQQSSGERDVLKALGAATGVFFVAGEPIRIVRAIKGTAIDGQLHKQLVDGLVLAGANAGALMMPEVVITLMPISKSREVNGKSATFVALKCNSYSDPLRHCGEACRR
jgi:cyanophycinase-like exopeptidase